MARTLEHACIVLMPFGESSGEPLFYSLVFEHVIKIACKRAGVRCIRVDKISLGSKPIRDEIENDIRTASIAIADVSDNNANVLFELGMRKAFSKEFILVSRDPSGTTFSANGFQVIDYSKPGAIETIAAALTQALEKSTSDNERAIEFAGLGSIIEERGTIDNPFQDALAAWRIRRAADEVHSVQGGEWSFPARSSENYVTHVFVQVMSMLAENDEYSTVTTSSFWRNSAIRETSFLQANIEAAEKGAKIRRVFLLNHEEIKSEAFSAELREIIQSYLRAIASASTAAQNRLVTHFRICSNFEAEISKYKHFGFAQRAPRAKAAGGSMLIEPAYLADRKGGLRISSLSVSFPSPGTDRYTDARNLSGKFEDLFLNTKPLSEYLRT